MTSRTFLLILLLCLVFIARVDIVRAEEEEAAEVTEQTCAEGDETCGEPAAETATDDSGEEEPAAEDEAKDEEAEEKNEAEPEPAAEEEAPAVEDPNCPSREHVIRCAGEYMDKNKNGLLERSELDEAVSGLPWWTKGLMAILGSVDQMMKRCDFDGDGAISVDADMENTKDRCLATCAKRKAFKRSFFKDCDL